MKLTWNGHSYFLSHGKENIDYRYWVKSRILTVCCRVRSSPLCSNLTISDFLRIHMDVELLVRILCPLLSELQTDTVPLVFCFVSVIRENFLICVSCRQLFNPTLAQFDHSLMRREVMVPPPSTCWEDNIKCPMWEAEECSVCLPNVVTHYFVEQFHLSWLCHFTRVSVEADCSESLSICRNIDYTHFHDLVHTHPALPCCSSRKIQVTQWDHVTHKGLWETGNPIRLHRWWSRLASSGVGMDPQMTGRPRLGN